MNSNSYIPAVNVSNNTRIVDAYPRYCHILAFMQKQLSFITFLSPDNTFHLTAYTFKTKKKWQPCRFRIILDWFSLIFYRVLEHFFKNGLKRIVQCFFLTFKFFWSPFWRRIMLPLKHDDLVSNRGIFKRIKEKLTGWFRLIWSDPNSRNLLGFLVLNLSFAFVELFYGVWTNSLGLISDSFHMFFDCTGLLAGLVRV